MKIKPLLLLWINTQERKKKISKYMSSPQKLRTFFQLSYQATSFTKATRNFLGNYFLSMPHCTGRDATSQCCKLSESREEPGSRTGPIGNQWPLALGSELSMQPPLGSIYPIYTASLGNPMNSVRCMLGPNVPGHLWSSNSKYFYSWNSSNDVQIWPGMWPFCRIHRHW